MTGKFMYQERFDRVENIYRATQRRKCSVAEASNSTSCSETPQKYAIMGDYMLAQKDLSESKCILSSSKKKSAFDTGKSSLVYKGVR